MLPLDVVEAEVVCLSVEAVVGWPGDWVPVAMGRVLGWLVLLIAVVGGDPA